MKKIIISVAALLGVSSVALNSCEEQLPQSVQEQFKETQDEVKSKVSNEMKEAMIAQIDEFLQNDDLEESLGFSEEQLAETEQSITQYIEDYELDTETLTNLVGEIKNLFDETQGLSKEEIQARLDEMLEK